MDIDIEAAERTSIEKIAFPENIQSIQADNIYSESNAILCAYNAGIMESVLDDTDIKYTVNGRMSTKDF